MSKAQAVLAVVLALVIGYVAGYATFDYRHPFRRQAVSSAGEPLEKTAPVFVHPIVAETVRARQLRDEGQVEEAKKLILGQLHLYPSAPESGDAMDLLGEINTELYFGAKNLYGKSQYVVQRGDSLARIARKLKSAPEMIMRMNDLSSAMLHPGETLLVPDGVFSITLDLSAGFVVVRRAGEFFKRYPVQAINLPHSSQARMATKVSAVTYWKNGTRVSAGDADFATSRPWIQLSLGGYTLYGVESAAVSAGEMAQGSVTKPPEPSIPARGIGILEGDVEELQQFVNRGTAVTILRHSRMLAHH